MAAIASSPVRSPAAAVNVSSHSAEAPLHQRQEQGLLGREEAEQVRLADPGPAGDVLGRGAGQAAHGELGDRGVEHELAALGRGHPLPGLLLPVWGWPGWGCVVSRCTVSVMPLR